MRYHKLLLILILSALLFSCSLNDSLSFNKRKYLNKFKPSKTVVDKYKPEVNQPILIAGDLSSDYHKLILVEELDNSSLHFPITKRLTVNKQLKKKIGIFNNTKVNLKKDETLEKSNTINKSSTLSWALLLLLLSLILNAAGLIVFGIPLLILALILFIILITSKSDKEPIIKKVKSLKSKPVVYSKADKLTKKASLLINLALISTLIGFILYPLAIPGLILATTALKEGKKSPDTFHNKKKAKNLVAIGYILCVLGVFVCLLGSFMAGWAGSSSGVAFLLAGAFLFLLTIVGVSIESLRE